MKPIAVFAALLATTACTNYHEFQKGLPAKEAVNIKLPATAGALTASSSQAVLNQTSEFYSLTKNATNLVNGATWIILDLVKSITDNTPTSLHKDSAVWGPYTPSLSANTYRLTVTKVGSGAGGQADAGTGSDGPSYSYVLEAKAKTAADSAYVAVLSGVHTKQQTDNYGHGSFLLDWNAAATLPEHDNNVGTMQVDYSHADPSSVVSVDATFHQVHDGNSTNLIDATYHYRATPGQGGLFQFSTAKDFITTNPDLETLAIESRWQETGAGRSDVRMTGGDVPASTPYTVNECWDSNFLSVYRAISWNPADASNNYGSASSCPSAYSGPEYYNP